jgi:hypothetical protein
VGSAAAQVAAAVAPARAARRSRLAARIVDLAPPGAGLGTAPLDELLEPLQVSLHAAAVHPERGADLLRDALRLPVQLHHHPRLRLVDPVEGDDAGIALPARRGPGDALVGMLLGDPGVPLLALAADLGDPVEVYVVELSHLLDAFHERRKLLELRPLVVRRLDGDLHVDRFLNAGHVPIPPRVDAPLSTLCP